MQDIQICSGVTNPSLGTVLFVSWNSFLMLCQRAHKVVLSIGTEYVCRRKGWYVMFKNLSFISYEQQHVFRFSYYTPCEQPYWVYRHRRRVMDLQYWRAEPTLLESRCSTLPRSRLFMRWPLKPAVTILYAPCPGNTNAYARIKPIGYEMLLSVEFWQWYYYQYSCQPPW